MVTSNKYNNSYKYVWNTQASELKSLANEDLSIYEYNKSLFVINYLINIYLKLDKNDSFSLEYGKNTKDRTIIASTLYDSYIDKYGKEHIEIVRDIKETLDRLKCYEIDTSGLYIDTCLLNYKEKVEKVKALCVKQSYFNKILREVTDDDIKKAINLYEVYKHVIFTLTERFGIDKFIHGLIYSNYFYIKRSKIKGCIKQINAILKCYGFDYLLKTDDKLYNVYKMKTEDIDTAVTTIKLLNN